MKIVLQILLIICFLGIPGLATAERVVLKTGESFDGTLIERNDQFITIKTGGAPVYLSLDHVERIIEDDEIAASYPPVVQPRSSLNSAVIHETQVANIPSASQQDGQFYYQQAKADLQAGKLDDSMKNLYTALSMGVKDAEGLKDQIEFARKALEKVKSHRNEIEKWLDQLDPVVLGLIQRVGIIIGVLFALFIVAAIYKKVSRSDISHFVKSRNSEIPLGNLNGNVIVRSGPHKRACAFLIDMAVVLFPACVITALAGFFLGISLIIVYILLKDCFSGQSVGKKILGIQIVDQDKQPAAPNSVVLRNFFWLIVFVLPLLHPYLVFASVIWIAWEYQGMLYDHNGQRLGDKLSSTRVIDLKSGFEDWKYLLISILIIVAIAGLYRLTVFGMSSLLGQINLGNAQLVYKDAQGRFSFNIPQGFIVDAQYTQDNALVFNHAKAAQLFSVFVIDLNQDQVFLPDQVDMAAVSFWSAKLKIEPQQIVDDASLTKVDIQGTPVAMYTYKNQSGTNVSACILNGKQFFEINFLFKDGQVDQGLIKEFLRHFRI